MYKNQNMPTDMRRGIGSLPPKRYQEGGEVTGRTVLENRLAALLGGSGRALSDPNSRAYRQRVILEKALAGEELSPRDAAHVTRTVMPSVRQLREIAGVDFRTAGSALGEIRNIQQQSLRNELGNVTPVAVDFSRLLLSEGFQENPMAALAQTTGRLAEAANLAPREANRPPGVSAPAPASGVVIGGAGPITLKESVSRTGQPFLEAYVTTPAGRVLQQTLASNDALERDLARYGYSLSQEDLDSLRSQVENYYSNTPEQPGRIGRSFLDSQLAERLAAASPFEAPRVDLPNVILQKSGPGTTSGWYYTGEEEVPYIPSDERFAYLASEQLMPTAPVTTAAQPVQPQQVSPLQAAGGTQVAQPTQPLAALDLISQPFQGVTASQETTPSMANTLANYYQNLYASPYFSYYGTPYMFENVFNQGVYNPQGSNE